MFKGRWDVGLSRWNGIRQLEHPLLMRPSVSLAVCRASGGSVGRVRSPSRAHGGAVLRQAGGVALSRLNGSPGRGLLAPPAPSRGYCVPLSRPPLGCGGRCRGGTSLSGVRAVACLTLRYSTNSDVRGVSWCLRTRTSVMAGSASIASKPTSVMGHTTGLALQGTHMRRTG